MFTRKVGRLPVVDEKQKLVGILSKGDIFRAVVGDKLPFGADEKFHDWLSRRFDLITDQKKRLSKEIPDLVRLFRKEGAKHILDVGCGTGVHAIALAEKGFSTTGIDRSERMIYVAKEKIKKLPVAIQDRIQFIHSEYVDLEQVAKQKFDAAIFMGAALAHNPNPKEVLREVNKVLEKIAIVVCQLGNYKKTIKINNRFYDFNVRKSSYPAEREQAFLRFFDPVENKYLTLNIAVFARGVKRWVFRGMHSTKISPLDRQVLTTLFKKMNFSDISFYGGEEGYYYDYLFRKAFDEKKSDAFVAVAKRN